MKSEVGSRIAKNSVYSFYRTFLTVPITLLIFPYIIKHLGKEEFGVWALVGVISSYAQLSDFGITESLIKFMAEYKTRNDTLRLNQLINTAFVVYLVLSIVFCLVFVLILPFVVNKILSIPQELQSKSVYVFTIAIVLFFVNMLMGVFGSLIVGFQQMGYTNLIATTSTFMTACGTFFFLYYGYGLKGLIYNNVAVTVFVIFSNLFIAWRLFPQLRFKPFRYFSREILKQILGFSWKVQISNITQLMIFQVDRVLLSHYVGLTAVGYYEVGNRIASQGRGIIISIFSPMVPAASALHAADEDAKITGLYRRSFKYMAIMAVSFSFLVIALAHPFVRTWMGSGYETSAVTIQLLMVAYMVNLLTGPGSFILSGINKPQIGMRSSIMAGITNLALCWVLVQSIGYYGVVAGVFVSILVSGLYFVRMVHRNLKGLDWHLYRQTLLRPLASGVVLCLSLLTLDRRFQFEGYLVLCTLGTFYLVLVCVALFQGEYLDDFDRATFARLNPLRNIKQ